MTHDVSDYFLRATGQRSIRAVALAADLDPSTLGRQLSGKNTLTVETVVALCRAHHLDMADAFVAAGFITDAEARRLGAHVGLESFTDLELAREIVRRIEAGEAGDALTGELPDGDAPRPIRTIRPDVPGDDEDDDVLAAASDSKDTSPDDRTDEGYI